MLALTLAVPAFALEESDVEAAVSSSSREAVTGNVLVWFLCAVGFLKVSQKIDSFMASIGVNVGHTGGSMLGEAMVAFKGVSLAAGMAGKVVGNFADRASSRAGATASGSSGFLQGGLAGVVSRKITNDAVRTATQTTQKASSSTMSAAHQATERTVNAERQAASVVHQAKQTRSESASQKSQTGVTHQQVASSTRTASVSSLHRESQHSIGLGGRIFTNSMLEGGRFANDVIGMVAAGDLHSTGSITGEFASQALSSYMGITAQGDAAPQISYSDVEIGGGLLKTRNTIEAVILGLAVGVPVLHLPFSLTVRVVILCLTALPLVLLALIGVSGMSLSAFIRLFFCFLHNRRILSRDGTQGGKNGKTLLPSWAQQRKSDCEAEDPPLPKSRSRFSVDLKQRSVTQFKTFLQEEEAVQPLNALADYIPIEKIEHGVIYTRDHPMSRL